MNDAMKDGSIVVKFRTVQVTLFPVQTPSGTYWRFRRGKRLVTRSTLEKAKAEARAYAESTYLAGGKIGLLSESQTRAIQRLLEVDPTLALVEDFIRWHSQKFPKVTVGSARAEFLAAKVENAGASAYNVTRLRQRLATLPGDVLLSTITPQSLPRLTGAPRTRANHIAAWTTFFRWCRRRGYLPAAQETAPELLDKPSIPRVAPTTWTRAELDVMLANVESEYLPWLVLSAWAGLRTEEVCPDLASRKDGLRWEDFRWDTGTIEIRAEVAKTGRRRLAPILPCLESILKPLTGSGRVFTGLPPHRSPHGGQISETTRLGRLVGGWKRNALRHSFISYRSAAVGTMKTAAEAGNSENVTRRNYHDAKSETEASEWFRVERAETR